jgi:hypothetical protein
VADDRLERKYWIGHRGLGELAGVGRDPVQLVERPAPALRARTAGRNQEAVHVEEDRLWSFNAGSFGQFQ